MNAKKRIGWVVSAVIVVGLNTGCGVTTKLQYPLPIKDFAVKKNETIALYIPDQSKTNVWKGKININPYSVEFGNALEPNAKYALSKVFSEVVVVDKFPPPPVSAASPKRAVLIEISGANVAPGAMTFSSTSSSLNLKATMSQGGQIRGEPMSVQGTASASPGVMGAIPILGLNQLAYNKALQKSAEGAMTKALEELVDAIIASDRNAPQ